MDTKFKLGQVIKNVNDPDGDFGVITEIHINAAGVTYTIQFDDFDRNTRQVIPAVKHVFEGDAVQKAETTPGAEGNVGEGVTA